MKLKKVGFDGYLLSDIACILENDEYNATEIEEVITGSDLCPADTSCCEYIVIYWKNLRTIFNELSRHTLAASLTKLQVEIGAEDEDLVFVQV